MRTDALGFFWEDTPVIKEKKEGVAKRTPPERTWEKPGYLPELENALAYQPHEFTIQEILLAGPGEELLYDVEVYRNFFCVTFESLKTGKVMYFELSEWCPVIDINLLGWLYTNFTCVGFNNLNYDSTIMSMVLAGKSTSQIKDASDDLIVNEMRQQDVFRKNKVKRIRANEYDLIEVAPLRASLKIYGGRLHTPEMQDLPFPPSRILSWEESRIIKYYNHKDLVNTRFLRLGLEPQITLRHEMSSTYGMDLRSRSDAQIAETVISEEVRRLLGYRPKQPAIEAGTVYKFNDPGFLTFHSELMQWVFSLVKGCDFVVAEHGSVLMPEVFNSFTVDIGEGRYSMGIGGLHSTESKTSHVGGNGYRILDRDVTSFYPYIILNQGLYPSHLGIHFLTVYRAIVEKRVSAKEYGAAASQAGDLAGEAYWKSIAESLKIVVNGSYGKLGNKYSVLYAPDLLIQTTLTGQLSLLMLIERMEMAGITVISANTDGVTMKVPDHLHATYEAIIKQWEKETSFNTEETEYLALYSRDVNNYIALKKPKKPGQPIEAKTKGAFANPWSNKKQIEPWLHINPSSQICVKAVLDLLTTQTPIAQTIKQCRDITEFVSVRSVNGNGNGAVVTTKPDTKNRTATEKMELVKSKGGMKVEGGWKFSDESDMAVATLDQIYAACVCGDTIEFLGKSVRWYYATGRDEFEMVAAKTGNRIPKTQGAKPCMNLPSQFPEDLDFDWYVGEAESILKQIAYA